LRADAGHDRPMLELPVVVVRALASRLASPPLDSPFEISLGGSTTNRSARVVELKVIARSSAARAFMRRSLDGRVRCRVGKMRIVVPDTIAWMTRS
jgi:hypothetical protein